MQPNDNTPSSPRDPYQQQPTSPEPQPPTQPFSTPAQPVDSWGGQPQPRNKKSLRLVLIIGGIIVLLGGGSAAALAYYNNPSKVLGDMLTNVMSAKSAKLDISTTIDSTQQPNPSKVVVTASGVAAVGGNAQFSGKATVTDQGKTYDVTGDFINADQMAYFRFTNLQQLLNYQTDPEIKAAYGPIAKKIDNSWIAFDILDDLTTGTTDNSNKCQDAIKSFQLSSADKQALQKLFSQHQFITVSKQLGSESINGKYSLHYQLSTNDKEAAQFQTEALKIASIKKLGDACGVSSDTSNTSTTTTPAPHMELWVDMWSHAPTKLLLSSQEDGTTTTTSMEDTLNVPVTVQKPSGAQSLKSIIQDAVSSLLSSSALDAGSADTTSL